MDQTAKDLHAFDWYRMFIGDFPWWFSFEIAFRTIVLYLVALLLIRVLSKRVVGQLALGEMMIIVALGSAIGDPMFYADVPLLHGAVVVSVVVLLNRVMLAVINRQGKLEDIVEGFPVLLVRNGLIEVDGLQKCLLSHEKLFESLRLKGYQRLGEVKEAYLEQGGNMSVFRQSAHKPSLAFVPPWDICEPKFIEAGQLSDAVEAITVACIKCGATIKVSASSPLAACTRCKGTRWVEAR
jgi:uncharacterized membrane protein YcaP (DUF421 family)